MRKICVIYGQDEQYACKLMDYFNEKKKVPYETVVFTEKQELQEFLRFNEVQVMIVSEEMYEEELEQYNIHKIIRLKEEELEDCEEKANIKVKDIYKYQPADNLVRELMSYCTEYNWVVKKFVGGINVIGIYSPVNRAYKTTFGLCAACVLGQQYKTLYINLEEFCGLENVLMTGGQGDISDAMYYYERNREYAMRFIRNIIMSRNGFDYIPPVRCADDIADIKVEEWIEFIQYVTQNGGYEAVVIDIGNMIQEQWKVMEMCKRVYTPIRKDYISLRRIEMFKEYVRTVGKEYLLEMLQEIEVVYDEAMAREDFMEQLEGSEMYGYVRRVLLG